MEMTDMEEQKNQGHETSDNKLVAVHKEPERRCSVLKGFGVPNVEGDFEEFVLDFDDYDLLESIHTHLGSSPETPRKLYAFIFYRSTKSYI